jgi:hypothetical protein
MAVTADIEASKRRLLAMSIDFESRATAADALIHPKPDEDVSAEAIDIINLEHDEGIRGKTNKKIAKAQTAPA